VRLVWALGVCFNLLLLAATGFMLLIASWVAYRVLWLGAPAGSSLGLDMVAPSPAFASALWLVLAALCSIFAFGLRICLHRSAPKAFD
jgi:hypothetical protein